MPNVKVTVARGTATVEAHGEPHKVLVDACVGANACAVLAARSALEDGLTQSEFEDILKRTFEHMYESTKEVFGVDEDDEDEDDT